MPSGVGSKFVLGTAQLGMRYGLVNDSGQPSRTQALEIIREALHQGVTAFDTARNYGDAEAIVGTALEGRVPGATVITKLGLTGLSAASEEEVKAKVDASIDASRSALRREKLDVLLLHRWGYRHAWRGAAWNYLLELQQRGVIRTLGASVYEPEEAISALKDVEIRHLQIPMNVLDWRWRQREIQRALESRADVVVHARSALLQGILAHGAERWPRVGGFDGFACAHQLCSLASRFGRDSVVDLCFAYLRSLSWIDGIVVGCETSVQLKNNLRLFENLPLSPKERFEVEATLPKVPEELLNPSKWKTERVAYAS
jgi:aryl-alcohol dehydrogenase-like predicted oxidoreductase